MSGEEKQKDIWSLAGKCNGDYWNCSSQLLKLRIGEPSIFFLVLEITQILELFAAAYPKFVHEWTPCSTVLTLRIIDTGTVYK